LEFGVVGEVEAELLNEEADAAIVVAHKDVDALDAKVRLRLRAGRGAGGHAGDYKTGRGSEEKDNAEAQGTERRAEDEKREQVPRSARDDGWKVGHLQIARLSRR
jgi:hypothetical protein